MRSNKNRTAIYARYSSHAQDDGTSIEVQLDTCRKIAGASPLEFIDRAETGRTMHRPAFNQMLDSAERGLFDKLVVARYDRFGRSAHTHAVISDLEELGIEVISCAEGRDQLARGIHLVVGEDFSRKLSKRVSESLNKRFEQRSWTGGPPPYGYRIEHRDKSQYLAVDPEEAKVVKLVHEIYLSETIGSKEIARRLQTKGFPTRRGAAWGFTQVRAMLLNRMYVGEVRFGKRKMKLNKLTGKRTPVRLDPSTHRVYTDEKLRIVGDEDFARVEAKMGERRKPIGAGTIGGRIRAFTGLIFCEDCGNVFYAQKSTNGGKHYYVCSGRQRLGRKSCPNSPTHREDTLLADVLAHFKFLFDDSESIIAGTIKELEKQIGSNRENTARLRSELAESQKTARGLIKILTDPGFTPLAKEMIQQQINEEAVKQHSIQINLDQMIERANFAGERTIAEVRRALADAKTGLEAIASPLELHAFMDRFVGPSVATADGRLLPRNTEGTGDSASAFSNIAATGIEPVTLGL